MGKENFAKKEIGYNDLKEHFISICDSYKDDEKAKGFVLLVWDKSNINISKMLKDKEYKEGLNEASGDNLILLALTSKEKKIIKTRRNKNIGGIYKLLVAVETEENIKDNYDELLSSYFNIKTNIEPPFLLFFITSKNKVLDSFTVKLKETNVLDTYNEIIAYLNVAKEAVNKIKAPYTNNYTDIFDNIKNSVSHKKFVKKVKIKAIIGDIGFLIEMFKIFGIIIFSKPSP